MHVCGKEELHDRHSAPGLHEIGNVLYFVHRFVHRLVRCLVTCLVTCYVLLVDLLGDRVAIRSVWRTPGGPPDEKYRFHRVVYYELAANHEVEAVALFNAEDWCLPCLYRTIALVSRCSKLLPSSRICALRSVCERRRPPESPAHLVR